MRSWEKMSRFALLIALIAMSACLCACGVTGVINGREHARNTELCAQPFGALPDGVYRGEASIAPPSGYMVVNRSLSVTVTVVGGSVTSIKVDNPVSVYDIKGFSDLEGRVISRQGLDVDCVSGATYSSIAFLKATERAVFK